MDGNLKSFAYELQLKLYNYFIQIDIEIKMWITYLNLSFN